MKQQPTLLRCADDLGLSEANVRRIAALIRIGAVDAVSLLPNGCLPQAAAAVADTDLPVAIHINLVEGPCCAPTPVPLLTDARGFFRHSFGGLLRLSLLRRRALAQQIYAEARAQIERVQRALPGRPLYLDGHQHAHMIPLVFRTLLRAAADSGAPIAGIRFATEPLAPLLRLPRLWRQIRPIGLVKQFVLWLLGLLDRPALRRSGLASFRICGLAFSGRMHLCADAAAPAFRRLAARTGTHFVFVFHPGYVEPGEPVLDPQKTSFNRFHTAPERKAELALLYAAADRPLGGAPSALKEGNP